MSDNCSIVNSLTGPFLHLRIHFSGRWSLDAYNGKGEASAQKRHLASPHKRVSASR
jgi:hypothetical protein